MEKYNQQEILKRNKIIKSQLLFGNFLNTDIILKLISLFDKNNNTDNNITKFIQDERKEQGLNNSTVKIRSEVYKTNKTHYTLHLQIIKNGIEFIHLSIHLISNTINSDKDGLIHIYKNIYKKSISSRKRYKLYALISVKQPVNKPNSLEFFIANGYNTPPNVRNTETYDSQIQDEMNIIVTVLNKLFDENNPEMYIGNKYNNKIYSVHNITNNVLNNINKYSKYTTRKNKGTKIFHSFNNIPIIIKDKNKRRTFRKII
jgi:hypothetical protein